MALARGALRWQMAVPEDGRLPYNGAFPALIAWEGAGHPAAMLPESGCRLRRLELTHPDAENLGVALSGLIEDARIGVRPGPAPALRAVIDTPSGEAVLE